MKTYNSVLNTIYIADNEQFSSLSKRAVQKWNDKGLTVDSLNSAEQNLWSCKGELNPNVDYMKRWK